MFFYSPRGHDYTKEHKEIFISPQRHEGTKGDEEYFFAMKAQ